MSTTNDPDARNQGQAIKPRLFVGSSVESLDVAYAVQENLEYIAEVTVWTQGIFNLTRPAFNSLLNALGSFDFAVFIFAPDDILRIRDESVRVARDNVIFELGLFMGELGEDRTFIIIPRGCQDLHLPTDLAGITPATYDPNRRDQNLNAALGPTCTRIGRSMQDINIRQVSAVTEEALSSPVTSGLSEELRLELARMLKEQEDRISEAFAKFEQRLSQTNIAQRETAKAPLTRTLHIIREELSPKARAFLTQIARVHLTFEQYHLLYDSGLKDALEELRHQNLIIPLTGRGKGDKKFPVYWFPPKTYKAILAALAELPPPEESLISEIRTALTRVGYKQ
jgi:predicted nucleotide-binding protein